MVELNKTINWKPKSTGEGRFGNWLENMVDWNLSRSRFWGTPLPIWKTEDGEEEICIGSIEELNAGIRHANKVLGGDVNTHYLHEGILDLHKPYVDDIILVSKSGKPMKRVPDLIDVWFDSGAMPYAQWHFPFENKESSSLEQKFSRLIISLKVWTRQEAGSIHYMPSQSCYLTVLLIKPVFQTDWCWIRTAIK